MTDQVPGPAGTTARKVVPELCPVHRVPFDAPWNWLAAGWRDLWTIPMVSLPYGAAFAVLAAVILVGLIWFGAESLILALAGGFLLVGPLTAVGLYDASRRLENGERPTLAQVARAGLVAPGQLGFMGAFLLIMYFIWLQIAFLIFMLFLGTDSLPAWSQFLPTLLLTKKGLGLLVFGTAAGAMLAAAVFAVSAISVPLLLARRVDVVTAMASSVEAVRQNPKAMALWAGLIAGFMLCGIACFFLGLIIVFPLIGHASWHAYRDLIDKSNP